MAFIDQWMTGPLAQDLAMTLLHSLWQGMILAGGLYILLNKSSKITTQTRYLSGIVALAVLLFCVFGTFAIFQLDHLKPLPTITLGLSLGTEPTMPMPPMPTDFPKPHRHIQTSRSLPWQTWALCVWATGACVMFLRMFRLLLGVHSLTRQSVPVEDAAIRDLIKSLKTRLRIGRRILVVTGNHLLSPGVIGFFRPILLLPMSLATGIPREDLEAILLHELAHIRRYDYLINFFQMVVEAGLFFNPAVWWINRQIRLEREACCDAVAVSLSGQRTRYAEILMQWSTQTPHQPNQVAAMVGFSTQKNASLAERIKRIVLPNHKPQVRLSLLSLAGMFLLSVVLLAALWKTTDTAVIFAAKILTPAERMETIDQIDQSFGAQAVQPRPEDRVTIAGTVRAEDGSSLPDDFYMRILAQNSTRGTSSGTRVKHGKFEHTMDDYYDSLYLLVERLDFSTAYVGPFHPERGQRIDNIEVILTHGFPGIIEVVDESGNPIEGAMVTGHYHVFKDTSPFMMDVALYPAGTIYGQIQVPEPTRLTQSSQDVDIQLLTIDTPDYMTSLSYDREIPFNGYWRPKDKYSIAPVPLGGTCVVVARHQFGWIKSEPIDLKEGQSIAQCDLIFPQGVNVTGTVISHTSRPLANVRVSLQFTTKIGTRDWNIGHHAIHADHQGRFVFAGVNPNIKGTYSLKVESPEGYAPTDMKIKPRHRPYTIKLTPAAR